MARDWRGERDAGTAHVNGEKSFAPEGIIPVEILENNVASEWSCRTSEADKRCLEMMIGRYLHVQVIIASGESDRGRAQSINRHAQREA